MMDHALQMAVLTRLTPKAGMKSSEPPINQIIMWQKAIKQLMINIRTRDSHEIEESRMSLKQAQNEISEYEETLLENRKLSVEELFFFRISESVRRLCAYARDFGEVLLNLKMYDEMVISNRS
jgi:hypothetical protein